MAFENPIPRLTTQKPEESVSIAALLVEYVVHVVRLASQVGVQIATENVDDLVILAWSSAGRMWADQHVRQFPQR